MDLGWGVKMLYLVQQQFIYKFFPDELQTDLEEEKAQEIAKLQDALHSMQLQVEEANAQVIKEREAAQKAIEEAPPVVKETPVFVEDTEKINSLMAEVESLKVGCYHLAICTFGSGTIHHYVHIM